MMSDVKKLILLTRQFCLWSQTIHIVSWCPSFFVDFSKMASSLLFKFSILWFLSAVLSCSLSFWSFIYSRFKSFRAYLFVRFHFSAMFLNIIKYKHQNYYPVVFSVLLCKISKYRLCKCCFIPSKSAYPCHRFNCFCSIIFNGRFCFFNVSLCWNIIKRLGDPACWCTSG